MSLAEDHVDWWLSSIRQPMIDVFEHGYKHGMEEEREECQFKKGEGWSQEPQNTP